MARISRRSQAASRARRSLDPRREIAIHHVTDGPAKGWLHTHGLSARGRPELEIRRVPLFLGGRAAALLNEIADYLLNDATAPLLPGQVIRLGRSVIEAVEGRPDAAAGYDPEHYQDGVRLVLVDPSDAGCACEECARELARGRTTSH